MRTATECSPRPFPAPEPSDVMQPEGVLVRGRLRLEGSDAHFGLAGRWSNREGDHGPRLVQRPPFARAHKASMGSEVKRRPGSVGSKARGKLLTVPVYRLTWRMTRQRPLQGHRRTNHAIPYRSCRIGDARDF